MSRTREPADGRKALDDDHVVIRLLDPAGVADDRLAFCLDSLLTPEERQRAEAFRLPRLRREYLGTRLLQRLTLSDLVRVDPADWRFSIAQGGRPEIAAPGHARSLRFSLSHTSGLIACAVTRGAAVGIDVEDLDHPVDAAGVAARFFAAAEANAIRNAAPERRRRCFLQHWTLKEACLKTLGTGLATPLDALVIRHGETGGIEIAFGPEVGENPDHWQVLTSMPTPRHVLGLALRKGPRRDLVPAIDWVGTL